MLLSLFTRESGPTSSLPSLLEFSIDPITGFIPPEPLPRLSREFKLWEDVLTEAPKVLKLGEDVSDEALALKDKGEAWRTHIQTMPILGIRSLKTHLRVLQRAHVVLVWLVQYYIHSLPPSAEAKRVPAPLAVPLVEVSHVLGIAPVITYSDTVIWNWELIYPENPVTTDNMTVIHTFSGREDEQHFYLVQAAIELHGVQLLHIIEEYNRISSLDQLTMAKITGYLAEVTIIIEEISDLIQSIPTGCDPRVFYSEMRPWFNGSNAKGSSDPGWIYEGVDPEAPELKYLSGPSGGQSTLMHALDLFLEIDHTITGDSSINADNKQVACGFMERMRFYMLGKHRAYLEHLQKLPQSVRQRAKDTPILQKPYNDAVAALKKLRRLHMRTAVLYIVDMARATSSQSSHSVTKKQNDPALEGATRRDDHERMELVRGSGGSNLTLLLRAGIDATARATMRDTQKENLCSTRA
ncbi:hypothetical protein GYMLUDRAFT_178103 [Collybiopsis luxurians FD-317 M1]|uniref:Indoleamine 2,3-dioxygenase n=1 Tax=Collybiopsis luxurians FD-317 M1 TaxID=944289 RepID=A0A0D0BGZ0_9AGAR|nr:hypothetical protein GYMLUDRAFT_178103 [Collybiopsis luxurians FD-317 M1]